MSKDVTFMLCLFSVLFTIGWWHTHVNSREYIMGRCLEYQEHLSQNSKDHCLKVYCKLNGRPRYDSN